MSDIRDQTTAKGAPKKPATKKTPAHHPWLHGNLSKEEADELLAMAGLDHGRYFVRSRLGTTTEFVLAVVYKGKPTHHLISKHGGNYLVNKRSYGDHPTLAALIATLQKPGVNGWPVPLANPVPSEAYLATVAKATRRGDWIPACTGSEEEDGDDALPSYKSVIINAVQNNTQC